MICSIPGIFPGPDNKAAGNGSKDKHDSDANRDNSISGLDHFEEIARVELFINLLVYKVITF